MTKKEGLTFAGLIGASDIFNQLISEGGFINPEFLNTLDGFDLKTIVLIGAIYWFYKINQKDTDMETPDVVCPFAPKVEREEGE